MPDYSNANIPSFDAIQDKIENPNPAEIQLLCDILAHFFFSKFESELGKTIKEKLDSLTKPKPFQQAGINKKHVLEFSLSLKLKKSIQPIAFYCLRQMKQSSEDDAWFSFPEAKTVFDKFPKLLTWKCKAQELELPKNFTYEQLLNARPEWTMREKIEYSAGIENCLLTNENLDLIFEKVVKINESREALFPKYMALGGYEIEFSRMAVFLKMMINIQSKMDRQDCKRLRNLSDLKLNINGISIMLTLAIYYYDQENSGKFLAEGINLAGEALPKLKLLSEELTMYENAARMAMCTSGLMECPIWFFNCLIYLIKVTITYPDPY